MSAIPSHHPKYRTKLCRNFSSGNCPFGQKCSFLHPAPGINPLSSSLAQYFFNWNMLLPQLLALQQGTLKKMSRWSPPQAPQLVDDDPSPPASLLLSTSDSASVDQLQQTRWSSRRKKLPCKQFVQTGGWCQAGERCKFLHDVMAFPPVEGARVQHTPPFETNMHRPGGQTIGSGALTGTQPPSPPIIGQEYAEPPRFTEVEPGQPYQPLYWPSYTWHPYFPSVSATAAVPATIAPSSLAQHNTYHPPPQPPLQSALSTTTQTSLPPGAYEVNGTTYFPTQMPPAPAPALLTHSVPIHPSSYGHAIAPSYPYYALPPPPASRFGVPNQRMEVRPHATFDPFSSDPVIHDELPVIPRFDYQRSPSQHDGQPHPLPPSCVLSDNSGPVSTTDRSKDLQEQAFPYQPPKEQRVGHARRISINVKKHGRTNSG